jgi:ATP-dependent Clp protease adaptor protein ClpS
MSTQHDTVEIERTKLKRPSKWKIILHNDDVTPMDFVVELLHYVFNLNVAQSTELMILVHTQGQGVAGIYPYEIAEQKYAEAQAYIAISSMQLRLSMEEEQV